MWSVSHRAKDLCAKCFVSYEDDPHIKLMLCAKCGMFRYCKRECQVADWKSFHKHECDIYSKYRESPILNSDVVRVALRCYVLQKYKPDLLTKKIKCLGLERSFNDLESHFDNIRADTNRVNRYLFALTHLSKFGISFDAQELLKMLCRFYINSFGMTGGLTSILNIELSIFDHSCRPNSAPICNDAKMRLVAFRDIAANEPIYLSYMNCLKSRQARQEHLSSNYYFICRCVRCESDTDDELIIRNNMVNLQNQIMSLNESSIQRKSEKARLLAEFFKIAQIVHRSQAPDLCFEYFTFAKKVAGIWSDVGKRILANIPP